VKGKKQQKEGKEIRAMQIGGEKMKQMKKPEFQNPGRVLQHIARAMHFENCPARLQCC